MSFYYLFDIHLLSLYYTPAIILRSHQFCCFNSESSLKMTHILESVFIWASVNSQLCVSVNSMCWSVREYCISRLYWVYKCSKIFKPASCLDCARGHDTPLIVSFLQWHQCWFCARDAEVDGGVPYTCSSLFAPNSIYKVGFFYQHLLI